MFYIENIVEGNSFMVVSKEIFISVNHINLYIYIYAYTRSLYHRSMVKIIPDDSNCNTESQQVPLIRSDTCIYVITVFLEDL